MTLLLPLSRFYFYLLADAQKLIDELQELADDVTALLDLHEAAHASSTLWRLAKRLGGCHALNMWQSDLLYTAIHAFESITDYMQALPIFMRP
jgi:hypothetical protein